MSRRSSSNINHSEATSFKFSSFFQEKLFAKFYSKYSQESLEKSQQLERSLLLEKICKQFIEKFDLENFSCFLKELQILIKEFDLAIDPSILDKKLLSIAKEVKFAKLSDLVKIISSIDGIGIGADLLAKGGEFFKFSLKKFADFEYFSDKDLLCLINFLIHAKNCSILDIPDLRDDIEKIFRKISQYIDNFGLEVFREKSDIQSLFDSALYCKEVLKMASIGELESKMQDVDWEGEDPRTSVVQRNFFNLLKDHYSAVVKESSWRYVSKESSRDSFVALGLVKFCLEEDYCEFAGKRFKKADIVATSIVDNSVIKLFEVDGPSHEFSLLTTSRKIKKIPNSKTSSRNRLIFAKYGDAALFEVKTDNFPLLSCEILSQLDIASRQSLVREALAAVDSYIEKKEQELSTRGSLSDQEEVASFAASTSMAQSLVTYEARRSLKQDSERAMLPYEQESSSLASSRGFHDKINFDELRAILFRIVDEGNVEKLESFLRRFEESRMRIDLNNAEEKTVLMIAIERYLSSQSLHDLDIVSILRFYGFDSLPSNFIVPDYDGRSKLLFYVMGWKDDQLQSSESKALDQKSRARYQKKSLQKKQDHNRYLSELLEEFYSNNLSARLLTAIKQKYFPKEILFEILVCSCCRSNFDVAFAVINFGDLKKDINRIFQDHANPLTLATMSRSKEIVNLLLSYKPYIDVNFCPDPELQNFPLKVAAQNNDDEILDILLESGADMNYGYESADRTAFLDACEKGNDKIVKMMIDFSNRNLLATPASSVLARRAGSSTAKILKTEVVAQGLMIACMKGSYEVANTILSLYCKSKDDVVRDSIFCIDMQDSQGKTMLMCALKSKSFKLLSLLLEYGADPFVKDANNKDIFDEMLDLGMSDYIKFVLKYCKNFVDNSEESKRILIDNGFKEGEIDKVVDKYKASCRKDFMARYILDHFSKKSSKKDCALLLEMCFRDICDSTVAAILVHKMPSIVNSVYEDGSSLLTKAIRDGNNEFVSFLLFHNANVLARDSKEESALVLALDDKNELSKTLRGVIVINAVRSGYKFENPSQMTSILSAAKLEGQQQQISID